MLQNLGENANQESFLSIDHLAPSASVHSISNMEQESYFICKRAIFYVNSTYTAKAIEKKVSLLQNLGENTEQESYFLSIHHLALSHQFHFDVFFQQMFQLCEEP